MESVSVGETCTETLCEETDNKERLPPTADTETAQDSDTRHTDNAPPTETEMEENSAPDTSSETETTNSASNSTSSNTSQRRSVLALLDEPNDVPRKGRQTAKDDHSPVSLKRKCQSLDESKLREHWFENMAQKKRQKMVDEAAEEAAKYAAANDTGPKYFVKDWMFLETLGEGAYGEVKLAYNDKTEEAVAVKIINTEGASKSTLDDVRKEICIHRMLNHKNIVRFWGMRKEGDTQYLFLEYAYGGELFDKIEPDVGMPQATAQKYFRQLVEGLEYLHKKGIAHRDIKPENLLLDFKDNLKIADFGLATVFRHQGKWRYLDRLCGSAPYLAPEVISGKPYRAEPADIWSSGVVLVAMLGGELPWDAAVLACTDYVNWRECHIEFRPWNKIDNLALCLLRKLLVENPAKRYTMELIRKNQWFKKDFSAEAALLLSEGPKRKRTRSSESDQSPGAISFSQPTMTSTRTNTDSADANTGSCDNSAAAEGPISFSQPAQADDLLLSSQINPTQSSQTPMQKLVRRMTRFFCRLSREEMMEELSRVFEQLDYTWKHTTTHMLTVHTVDRRQSPLIFKAMILEMGDSLLVDFRLSKGDGLEFKRQFMRIRELMKTLICKVPSSWPNLPNV